MTIEHFIGLMSGTSLDGVDGVVAQFNDTGINTLGSAHVPFSDTLRRELLTLQASGRDEIHREAMVSQELARLYGLCVERALASSDLTSQNIAAIGCHGQTIRHRPELGYTRQINHPALLAELTGITVVADFRSRDIAAGGQGAPLVPAFHRQVFGSPAGTRVVVNIGGISNISVLGEQTSGYDTGPGNVLMDAWIYQHRGEQFDANGDWAASGQVLPDLLQHMLAEPYFTLPAPKSTGRDLFHMMWLEQQLRNASDVRSEDVQATLCELTAITIADAIAKSAPQCQAVYVCGGGARNLHLMSRMGEAFKVRLNNCHLGTTLELGVATDHVEALAFAWLARCALHRLPGNLPAVTGARGLRVLGAIYPA